MATQPQTAGWTPDSRVSCGSDLSDLYSETEWELLLCIVLFKTPGQGDSSWGHSSRWGDEDLSPHQGKPGWIVSHSRLLLEQRTSPTNEEALSASPMPAAAPIAPAPPPVGRG